MAGPIVIEIYQNQNLSDFREDNSKFSTNIKITWQQTQTQTTHEIKTPSIVKYVNVHNPTHIMFPLASAYTIITKLRHKLNELKPSQNDTVNCTQAINDLVSALNVNIYADPTNYTTGYVGPSIIDDNRFLIIPTRREIIPYILAHISKVLSGSNQICFPPFYIDDIGPKQATQKVISLICSYYLNSLFYIGEGRYYQEISRLFCSNGDIQDMLDIWDIDRPEIRDVSQENLDMISDHGAIDYTSYAFAFLAGISKLQAQPDHIKEWLGKRISPLLISCKFLVLTKPVAPSVQYDLSITSTFLDSNLSIRRLLYTPLLTQDLPDNQTMKGLISQLKLMLEYTNLTTFRISLQFADACETEVHLIPEIIRQCNYIIDQDNHLMTLYPDGYKYLYFLRDIPTELQVHNYPDLSYAAFFKKKLDVESFKNYAELKHDGMVSKRRIETALGVPLLDDNTTGVNLTPEVSAFLTAHQKKAKTTVQLGTNILAQLQALLANQNQP